MRIVLVRHVMIENDLNDKFFWTYCLRLITIFVFIWPDYSVDNVKLPRLSENNESKFEFLNKV